MIDCEMNAHYTADVFERVNLAPCIVLLVRCKDGRVITMSEFNETRTFITRESHADRSPWHPANLAVYSYVAVSFLNSSAWNGNVPTLTLPDSINSQNIPSRGVSLVGRGCVNLRHRTFKMTKSWCLRMAIHSRHLENRYIAISPHFSE